MTCAASTNASTRVATIPATPAAVAEALPLPREAGGKKSDEVERQSVHDAQRVADDRREKPAAFAVAGLMYPGALDNWTKILAQFPATAKLANIQCENCHGPQNSPAHMKKDGSRKTMSSDLCGSCHGEPLRHGRKCRRGGPRVRVGWA